MINVQGRTTCIDPKHASTALVLSQYVRIGNTSVSRTFLEMKVIVLVSGSRLFQIPSQLYQGHKWKKNCPVHSALQALYQKESVTFHSCRLWKTKPVSGDLARCGIYSSSSSKRLRVRLSFSFQAYKRLHIGKDTVENSHPLKVCMLIPCWIM